MRSSRCGPGIAYRFCVDSGQVESGRVETLLFNTSGPVLAGLSARNFLSLLFGFIFCRENSHFGVGCVVNNALSVRCGPDSDFGWRLDFKAPLYATFVPQQAS